MAEQISRRANNVTASAFEAPFETQIVRFGQNGLNLKDSLDAMQGWSALTNIWHEHEGEATIRPGETSLATVTAGQTVHAVRKLRDPHFGSVTRFWGVDSTLRQGTSGALAAAIDTGYSGDPLTLFPHRPPLSGEPWMFIADRSRMRKVRADGLVLPIGLPIPSAPPTATLHTEYKRAICLGNTTDSTQAAGWAGAPGKDDLGNATDTPDPPTDETSSPSGTGDLYFITKPGSIVTTYDTWWGIPITRDLTELDAVSPVTGDPSTKPAADDDVVHLWMKLSHPQLAEEVRLYIVVSSVFSATVLPTLAPVSSDTPPGSNTDAYVKAFRPNDYVQFAQATSDQITAAEQARVFALRDKDAKTRGVDDTRDSWEDARAQTDPKRAPSLQLGLGTHQWFEYGNIGLSLRRGDFQRLGSDPNRDWSTVTGVIVYIRTRITAADRAVALAFNDCYLAGGAGPDTMEPGAQQYDYRTTNYDPRTGAESNGSDEMTSAVDSLRRILKVTPAAHSDSAMRQRVYRRGGSIIDDWDFCGVNTSNGGAFLDDLSDDAIVTAGPLPDDHYQPVPTVTDAGATVLAQPVPALWGPLEGMIFACGDPYRPGHLYFSIAGQPDHWSADGNVEVCPPSEELMHGGVAGHQGFVFSRNRLHLIYPNLSGTAGVTTAPSLCTRGLLGRWAFCVGPGGLIYFVAEDGVFATSGGPEDWLSEAINPLFYGTAVNGYQPIDKATPTALRLTTWENCLYFQYRDTGGGRQVLVYSILQKFWRHYSFGKAPAVVQGEDEDVLVIGGYQTGAAYTHDGTSDAGTAISWRVRTGSMSGGRREEKLYGDVFFDVDLASQAAGVQIFLNEETHANTVQAITTTGTGRERFLIGAFGDNPQKAHSIACEVSGTSSSGPPTLYQIGYSLTLQPELTNSRVTNWDDLNYPDETWVTGVTLDCDTGGVAKTIIIEGDFAGARFTIATFDVTADNRHKFKFSWPAVSVNQVRIRPDSGECTPWLLYRADWIYLEEPPRISKWDVHFENAWDQYYTGLDLYCCTFGLEKRIEVYVDGVQLTNTLASLTYWPVTTSSRQVVHLTLPWGRGHVFRFKATDDNPGLLYTHRWHLAEEPSEQANWNQNFSILGTRADKYLKAVIFECDTFGANKSVQVEADGVTVETLTVNTTGRKVVQLALSNQALGRVWRMFPVDANPGRLYSAEPIFDEEPFALTRWETQETNHGLPGWFYPLFAHITLKSSGTVTLRTIVHHNQTGGTTTEDYTITSTGGVKQRRFLPGFKAHKGVLIKYILTCSTPFWLYRDETTVVIQPWGAANSIVIQPFGNDDQDPSRPMQHAVLAAQASGGIGGGGKPGSFGVGG